MTSPDVLDDAHQALRAVVGRLDAEDWSAPTPCSQWNVAQVFRHAVLDQHSFARAITGGPGATEDQFAPDPQRPDGATGYLEAGLGRARAAFDGVAADDPAVPTPWPGTMTAGQVRAACALDAVVHAWDISVATGQPSPLSPDCASVLLAAAPAFVEPLRGYYAPALPPVADDDPAQALLRYLGRDPAWMVGP